MTTQTSTPLAAFFPLHNLIAASTVAGFTPAMWTTPPQPATNHPVWIFTHLVQIRRDLASNFGEGSTPPVEEPRAGFGDDCLPADRYSSPDALLREFQELGDNIATALTQADNATLASPFQPTFPDGKDRTVAEAVTFLITHEALHIGQISLIRKLQHLPGFAEQLVESMRSGAAAKPSDQQAN